MVSINYSAREVCCKIVYYGPGLSGKTTNLQYVHAKVPQTSRGKLISLATEADRTLYFDFLPINIGTINGFQAKFQLYTVPGQVYYNATRKLVLRGVDGLVFVADSQADKMDDNIESLMNLEENLREYGYDANELPIVIQYNKRDLPTAMSIEDLNQKLNPRNWPHFEASAPNGHGVFDTLKLIIKLVLDKAKQAGSSRPMAATAAAPQPAPAPAPAPPVYQSYPSPAAAAPVSMPTPPIAPQPAYAPAAAHVAANPEQRPAYNNQTRPIAIPEPAQTPSYGQQPGFDSTPSYAPHPAPVAAEQVYRPYPGSNKTGGVTIAPAPFPDALPPQATTQTTQGVPLAPQYDDSSRGVSPQMAPSMKKVEPKKRGFFKQLFGIK